MLSHLVGAANRADIRRLRQLEQANTELEAKVGRQQQHLRDAILSREATIRALSRPSRSRVRVNATLERSALPIRTAEFRST